MTLRVAQFFLKIAHLSFSMGPRGPRAYGLRPRLWLLIHPRNFGCDVSVRPYRLWERGKGVTRQPDGGGGGGECFFFLAGNRAVLLGAFGQPAFFLAGNRMTIVAFEKEVSLRSLSKGFLDSTKSFELEKNI